MNSTQVSFNFPLRYILLFSFFIAITLANLIGDHQYNFTDIQRQKPTAQDNKNGIDFTGVIFNSVNISTPEFAQHVTFDDKFNTKKNPTIVQYVKSFSQSALTHYLFSTIPETHQAHSPILRI